MAVRGPTGVGAHVGQLGEHYVSGLGVSTRGRNDTPAAYGGPHDYAYVHPAVVGRLTAAALTYAFNGRRLGGRSFFPLRSS